MGNDKVTIDSIAQALGCSKTTVSRAISGKGRVSKETRKRVLDYCREYGYRSGSVSKAFDCSRTYNLAAVLPADQELQEIPFFPTCLFGICEWAAKQDYNVFVVSIEKNRLTQLQKIIEKRKIDGVILMRALVEDSAVEYLLRNKIPFVQIGDTKNASTIHVDHDSVRACKEMTEFLLEREIQRIALIGGDMGNIVTQKRLAGFYAGFTLFHKVPKDKLIYLNCDTNAKVYEAVEQIVENCAECIVCMDDKICTQVLKKLDKMRILIPRDLEIVSFYDSLALQNYSPTITALKFDEEELGRIACEKLIDRLENGGEESILLTEYSMELRESTKKII
ncbi:LacI family DNA-binding transcriptional regulator [Bariatricus sp. SGI.154]|uniref:LacI family DNA-binding transcriptional regulator n=1 Tax=Bariatricus sp. SGI.154 TaxID=3420549 RepID=UPI003CFE6EC5